MISHSPIAMLLVSTLGAGPLWAQTANRTAPVATQKPVAAPAARPIAEPARGALTNADILKMTKAGLSEAVVLATLRAAPAMNFDLSPDGLIALKRGGVSDAVVAVMIDPRAVEAAPAAVAGSGVGSHARVDTRARVDSATASPEIPREPGIYWDKGHEGAHHLIALEPTVFSQGKTGGFLTSAMTYGIKKAKMRAVTRGSAAGLHITDRQPTFYFYFESKASGLGSTGGFAGWLAGATSPNEFILARMTSKSKDRELIVGEWGAFGGNSGTRSQDTINLHIDRLDGGIYRARSAEVLEPGEYCFFYAGGVGTVTALGGGAGKLFDFGIYEAER